MYYKTGLKRELFCYIDYVTIFVCICRSYLKSICVYVCWCYYVFACNLYFDCAYEILSSSVYSMFIYLCICKQYLGIYTVCIYVVYIDIYTIYMYILSSKASFSYNFLAPVQLCKDFFFCVLLELFFFAFVSVCFFIYQVNLL